MARAGCAGQAGRRPHFSIVAILRFSSRLRCSKNRLFREAILCGPKKLSQVKRKTQWFQFFAAVGLFWRRRKHMCRRRHRTAEVHDTIYRSKSALISPNWFGRQGFSECGLCSHQEEEWFGIGKFQVSDVAWTSACGGGVGARSLPCPAPKNLQA